MNEGGAALAPSLLSAANVDDQNSKTGDTIDVTGKGARDAPAGGNGRKNVSNIDGISISSLESDTNTSSVSISEETLGASFTTSDRANSSGNPALENLAPTKSPAPATGSTAAISPLPTLPVSDTSANIVPGSPKMDHNTESTGIHAQSPASTSLSATPQMASNEIATISSPDKTIIKSASNITANATSPAPPVNAKTTPAPLTSSAFLPTSSSATLSPGYSSITPSLNSASLAPSFSSHNPSSFSSPSASASPSVRSVRTASVTSSTNVSYQHHLPPSHHLNYGQQTIRAVSHQPQMDIVDVLDTSDPWGLNLHHSSPYDALSSYSTRKKPAPLSAPSSPRNSFISVSENHWSTNGLVNNRSITDFGVNTSTFASAASNGRMSPSAGSSSSIKSNSAAAASSTSLAPSCQISFPPNFTSTNSFGSLNNSQLSIPTYRSSPLSRNSTGSKPAVGFSSIPLPDPDTIDMLAETRNRRKTLSASHTPISASFSVLNEESISPNESRRAESVASGASTPKDRQRRELSWGNKLNIFNKKTNTSGSTTPENDNEPSALSIQGLRSASLIVKDVSNRSYDPTFAQPIIRSFVETSKAGSEPSSPTGSIRGARKSFWGRKRSSSMKDLRKSSNQWSLSLSARSPAPLKIENTDPALQNSEISPQLTSNSSNSTSSQPSKSPSLVEKPDIVIKKRKSFIGGSLNSLSKRLSQFSFGMSPQSQSQSPIVARKLSKADKKSSKSAPNTPSKYLSPNQSRLSLGISPAAHETSDTQEILLPSRTNLKSTGATSRGFAMAGLSMSTIPLDDKSSQDVITEGKAKSPVKIPSSDARSPMFSQSSPTQEPLILVQPVNAEKSIKTPETPSSIDYAMPTQTAPSGHKAPAVGIFASDINMPTDESLDQPIINIQGLYNNTQEHSQQDLNSKADNSSRDPESRLSASSLVIISG